jgi:ADP-heptose:LPS heptosyltransferase
MSAMREKPIVACGEFTLKQFGALCKRADVFVSADSGPLHIATAVGTKNIVAIFGPTSPLVTGPSLKPGVAILQKDVGCTIPCYEVGCKNNRCMKAVTVEEVIEHVKQWRT